MTFQLLQFPQPPKGNGVRRLVKDYFERIHPARTMAKSIVSQAELDAALSDEDNFLVWLWQEGFKIVPLDGTEPAVGAE